MTKHTKTELKTVLLTGFEPFGGESINPSWQAVKQLHGQTINDHQVECVELPCEFGRSLEHLYQAIEKHQPSLVLCIGQAGGRSHISIERVAINIDDARIADNAGNQPVDTAIIADAPAAYFAKLPIKTMFKGLIEAGIPAEVSNTAGTYVCNHVMYGLLHYIARHFGENDESIRGGFIHIPFLPEQAVHHSGAPSMSQTTVVTALKLLIENGLSSQPDLKVAAGTTH